MTKHEITWEQYNNQSFNGIFRLAEHLRALQENANRNFPIDYGRELLPHEIEGVKDRLRAMHESILSAEAEIESWQS